MPHKIRKQFILDNDKIKKVRKIVGAVTDTEAVDRSLDLVLANERLQTLHRKMAGRLKIEDRDQSHFDA